MLRDDPTYATLPTADLERARGFFRDTLGMRELMVTDGGVMFGSGATQFFVYPTRLRAAGHTQMSWVVPDIKATVADLRGRGVAFEELEIPGIEVVDGVAHSGAEVWTAWFKDPDGNVLGLTQIGEGGS